MARRAAILLVSLFVLAVWTPATALAAAPTITSFSPPSGPIGTSVTVHGTNLLGTSSVKFGGIGATFSNVTATSLKAVVPAGSSTGKISVTTPGGSATSAASFNVTIGILLSKSVAPPGAAVLVSGSGFSPSGAVELYFDGTQQALVAAGPKGTFVNFSMTVPTFAAPGTHWITAINRATSTAAQLAITVRTDWAQFRSGPMHRARNSTERQLGTFSVSGLEEAWTTNAIGVSYSSPAVAGGVVYVGASAYPYDLYAFASGCASGGATCTPLWKGATSGAVSSSPAVANGVVYVGSNDGFLYAFKVGCATGGATCAPIWKGSTGGYSSPTVAGGVVYVGSYDGELHAFAVGCATGGAVCPELWHSSVAAGTIFSSPAVANGVVYLGFGSSHRMYAFPASCSGACAPLWYGDTGGDVRSSPAVAGGVVYVGSDDGSLYAFKVGCGTRGASCSALWHGATGAAIGLSSPAVGYGNVYVGSSDGNLYAFAVGCGFSGATCTPVWTGVTGVGSSSSPAIANGVVYVGSGDGNLYAFPAAQCNGRCYPLWVGQLGDFVDSSPAVANGAVYFTSGAGKLFAFDLNDPDPPAAASPPDPRRLVPDPDLRSH